MSLPWAPGGAQPPGAQACLCARAYVSMAGCGGWDEREWRIVTEDKADGWLTAPIPAGKPAEIDTSVAHPARVYDYWLGGKDNFAADREAGDRVLAVTPGLRERVRAGRAFLVRAVRYLAAEEGIRQFLDVGTGIPSANNTHEVAQQAAPDARVVYVDNDPIVLTHARALLAGSPEGSIQYFDGDVRDVASIIGAAAKNLDFTRPTALMLLGVLQLNQHAGDRRQLVATVRGELPSDSYLDHS